MSKRQVGIHKKALFCGILVLNDLVISKRSLCVSCFGISHDSNWQKAPILIYNYKGGKFLRKLWYWVGGRVEQGSLVLSTELKT